MARSIKEIQQKLIDAVVANTQLNSSLNSQSSTAIWRLWTHIVATALWTVENLFDLFRIETDEKIADLKPHSLRWYAVKSKAFMYGVGLHLIEESDQYDVTGLTEAQIAEKKLVAHAAVVELDRGLRIKVAKNQGADLAALEITELDSFKHYMDRIKDAGVKLLITSTPADSLKLTLQVYYDPLILNERGERIDGTDPSPVKNAVKKYLKNLPFNGVLVTEYLVDALQKVDGVVVPHIMQAAAKYGALDYLDFAVKYTPDSGYLKIYVDNDPVPENNHLQIQFIPQNVIN